MKYKDNFYTRLKSSIDKESIENRLEYNPHTIELHLFEEDLYEPRKISDTVRMLKDKGIKVIIHQPMEMRGKLIDINTEGYRRDLYFLQLGMMSQLADELDVYVVVHGNYITEDINGVDIHTSLETFKRIENVIGSISKNILWENAFWSGFSYQNERLIEDIIKPLNLPLCLDLSHAFIDFKGDNEKLLDIVKELHPYIKHFHVVDSFGIEHDSLTLGDGKINFKQLKPYIVEKSFIYEVGLKDFKFCDEMILSKEYFKKL